MDWITNIVTSGASLPWPAVVGLLLFCGIIREAIPAALKVMGFSFEREKYKDAEAKAARDALVEDLKKQINGLCDEVNQLSKKLEISNTAHSKCEIEQEKIRGDLRVMQVQIDALMRHDKANADNTKKLAEIIKDETGKVI